MTFFTVLLLAGLTSTSLAILNEPEDEFHLKTLHTNDPAQLSSISHPRKDHVANEDLSKETFIFKEEPTPKENVVIKSTRPKSQKLQLLHNILQEDRFRKAELQLEETTKPTLGDATTSEGKLAKILHEIKMKVDKLIEGLIKLMEDIIPSADSVMRP